jgi:hypothetical protein
VLVEQVRKWWRERAAQRPVVLMQTLLVLQQPLRMKQLQRQ